MTLLLSTALQSNAEPIAGVWSCSNYFMLGGAKYYSTSHVTYSEKGSFESAGVLRVKIPMPGTQGKGPAAILDHALIMSGIYKADSGYLTTVLTDIKIKSLISSEIDDVLGLSESFPLDQERQVMISFSDQGVMTLGETTDYDAMTCTRVE